MGIEKRSVIFAILADLFVTIPTIVKTYHEPETEPPLLWLLYTFAASLAMIATTPYTVYNLLYPLYITLGAFLIGLLALRGKMKKV